MIEKFILAVTIPSIIGFLFFIYRCGYNAKVKEIAELAEKARREYEQVLRDRPNNATDLSVRLRDREL